MLLIGGEMPLKYPYQGHRATSEKQSILLWTYLRWCNAFSGQDDSVVDFEAGIMARVHNISPCHKIFLSVIRKDCDKISPTKVLEDLKAPVSVFQLIILNKCQ